MNLATADAIPDLMLTQGGPGHAALRRLKLVNPEARSGLRRAALFLMAITWVPLCLLSLIEKLAFGGVSISFFHDLAAQVRFLIGVPILVLADIPVGIRLRQVARQFLTAGLVSDADIPRYAEIVAGAVRLRDSRSAELILVGLAYMTTFLGIKAATNSGSTWFRPGTELAPVGYWYVLVSMPIWMFLIGRWAFRMVVWTRFLVQVSKMDLVLSPAHPDGAAGLGFLGKGLIPFGAVGFAFSAVISAGVASRIIYTGAHLEDFRSAFIFLVLFILIIFTGPLLVFTPRLIALRQTGLLRYGTMASRYIQFFDRRWVDPGENVDEQILGTEDIQSLGSLGDSYDMVRQMKVIPMELSDFIALALPTAIPALPLVLTVVPMKVILGQLLRFIV